MQMLSPPPPIEKQKQLNQEEQFVCEGSLSKKECLEALKSMASENLQDQMAFPENFTKFSEII